MNVTVSLSGTGLFAGVEHVDQVYRWQVRPARRTGTYNLSSCMARFAGTGASLSTVMSLEFDTDDRCQLSSDGSMMLFDQELGIVNSREIGRA